MPASADDDVVVHGDAERRCDIDDRLGHLDIGLRRGRIAGGMVVHQDDCALLLRNELSTSDGHDQRIAASTGRSILTASLTY